MYKTADFFLGKKLSDNDFRCKAKRQAIKSITIPICRIVIKQLIAIIQAQVITAVKFAGIYKSLIDILNSRKKSFYVP